MFHVPEKYRVKTGSCGSDKSHGNNGAFQLGRLNIVASDQEGWEHVSVSLTDRQPRWNEMCKIKDLFWDKEDCVIQYHPPESKYVNNHPYVLHMWRPTELVIPMPPIIMV